MKPTPQLLCRKNLLLSILFLLLAGMCAAQKVAITFDDLPLNGMLPPGVTRVETTRNVLAILKKRHVPAVYGFINAKKLEGSADGAEALKLWAAAEPVGNHTYAHIDLEQNTAEAFEREIEEDEPALELLANKDDWRWLRYPFLHEGDTVEKRRAVRAYLKSHGYRIAQVTLDWEDYLWNTAYARCAAKSDAKSIEWLKTSYLSTASEFLDLGREQARLIYGHEINYVLLLHLGAFSSTILPEALDLLKKKGFKLVTLEEAESDAAYEGDPDAGLHDAGTLLDQWMQVKQIKYPEHVEKPYKEIESVCR
ncbi:MAG TPA: polysaccharide deacetylase family protein [Candidatus Dormibacteraeota bacterium]|jgi:peptidoglycan/xylan/chitin deacetylase (PgdA/CDA1 family)|nr:polysaccharide deacetylase family protein [Candidatus Dormibacteraeota bacterium]